MAIKQRTYEWAMKELDAIAVGRDNDDRQLLEWVIVSSPILYYVLLPLVVVPASVSATSYVAGVPLFLFACSKAWSAVNVAMAHGAAMKVASAAQMKRVELTEFAVKSETEIFIDERIRASYIEEPWKRSENHDDPGFWNSRIASGWIKFEDVYHVLLYMWRFNQGQPMSRKQVEDDPNLEILPSGKLFRQKFYGEVMALFEFLDIVGERRQGATGHFVPTTMADAVAVLADFFGVRSPIGAEYVLN